ncbi:hypothetical protein NYE70_11410 [Paenibacillus sp. FSL R5-0407]|uniref:hypothetical protein n=1 Tax=Paenibacillus sp. FSL R5-0407 TaxID=2975320 RepID=UPI0030F73A4C
MPKVLITNGSVIGTWYAGKTGKIYDISHVSTEVYMMKENDLPAPFHKAVRKEDGELLYTEAEYNKILQQREKAINDLAKHAQTIVDMQKEKLRLQDEVDMPRDKVELPRDVFNAIESFRDNGWSPEDIFLVSDRPDDGEWAATLYKWRTSSASAGRKLLNALVNGYTVEQSPEEQLQEKIEALIQEWYCSPSVEDLAKGVKPLASRIVEHAKQLT